MGDRIVERFANGHWFEIEFEYLSRNDVFRMFNDKEKTEPVTNEEGVAEFIAASDPYINVDNIYEIRVAYKIEEGNHEV